MAKFKAPKGANAFSKATYDAANNVGDSGLGKSMIGSIAFGNDLFKALTANKLDETLDPRLKDSYDLSKANVDLLMKGFDPETQGLIDTMKGGLGGFTAPELEAQRSGALNSILSQSQSDLGSMLGSLGARNLQGGIAAKLGLGINNQALKARSDLESELFSKQAQEQDTRMTNYGNFLNQANTGLNTAKANAFNALNTGANNAATYVQNAKVTNLNNLNAATTAQYGTPFSFGQLYETDQGRKDANKNFKLSLDYAKNSFGQGSGGGGGSKGGGSKSGGGSGGSSSGFQNSGLN